MSTSLSSNLPQSTTNQETHTAKQRRGGAATAAVKECCRIFCTTFLSLFPALSLLLLSRLSPARRQMGPTQYHERPHKNLFAISTFLHTKATLALSFLLFATAVAALMQCFAGDKRAWLVATRRRLHGAVLWIFSLQVCLSLWIYGVLEADRIGSDGFGSLAFIRSVVLGLGLHETVVFWRRKVVKPAVDEAVLGFSEEGFSWGEKVVLAAAVGWLWWRRLRREAEEVVALGRDVEVVDVVGWLLYGLTAAVGGVRVVKGLLWLVNGIFRRSTKRLLPLIIN